MSNGTIKASGIAQMTEICAELAQNNVVFEAKETSQEEWTIEITGY